MFCLQASLARMGVCRVHMEATVELISWLGRGAPPTALLGLSCLVHCWEWITGGRR